MSDPFLFNPFYLVNTGLDDHITIAEAVAEESLAAGADAIGSDDVHQAGVGAPLHRGDAGSDLQEKHDKHSIDPHAVLL
jgi:hypothetical protein